jgi:IS30 family transposase
MAGHVQLAADLGTSIYSCDAHSPWQRPTSENTNGLLRDYFPKGTDLAAHSAERLREVQEELNNRPRKCLNWEAPATVFARLQSDHS